MAKKFYKFIGDASTIDNAKMPRQQKQILRAAASSKVKMQGAEIVDLAKEKFSLETRQKSTVLYAWYARSNEELGYVKEVE